MTTHNDAQVAQSATVAAFKALEDNAQIPWVVVTHFRGHFDRLMWDAVNRPPSEKLAIHREAVRVCQALAGLSMDARLVLQRHADLHIQGLATPESIEASDRALLADPILAPIKAAMVEWMAGEDQRREKAGADINAAYIAGRPAAILAGLRADGIDVAMDGKGRLTAPAGCTLSQTQIADVSEYKAGIVELLRSEAAAAAPVVIA